MDLSFFAAFIPFNTSFLGDSIDDFLGQVSTALESAFLPENLAGTITMIVVVLAIIAIAFPIIRFLLGMCSKLWQAVLLVLGMMWVGTIITNGLAYSTMAAGLIQDMNVGIAGDLAGQVAIIVGIAIAYLTTPKRLRMF